jgi:predicted nucleic acid-binding protein
MFWTSAFAGVTLQETFYEIINIDFRDGYIAAVMGKMKITDIYSFDKKHISRIRELKRIEA